MSPPSSEPQLPAVDERLVAPETRYEIIDGRVVYVPPCFEPHGASHAKLAALLDAHKHPDYRVALDMLTRTSETDDFAPDASLYPVARHHRTGGRQLEELAFEILNTHSLGDIAVKARKLSGRGVRRIFAIQLEHLRAFEWSSRIDDWSMLDLGATIEDGTLAVPIPVAALVDAERADESIREALRISEREAGRLEGKIEGLLAILGARGLQPSPDELAAIRAERDLGRLGRWLAASIECSEIAALLRLE